MARGYSLEQLRNELQYDAQLKCEELEKTVVELQKQLTEKEEKIADQQKVITVLQNRCVAQTGRLLCPMCGLRHNCDHYKG